MKPTAFEQPGEHGHGGIPLPALPITAVLPQIADALKAAPRVLLHAPPGAGKTTLVPLFLLPGLAEARTMVMLEPRRVAARAAAARLAALLGEPVGRTVGYRVRFDQKCSRETRILVVTEGVLTRMLRDAPDLPGTSLVIFDEFHERSIHADTGLALALECQENLREEADPLSIVVMSATLETKGLETLLRGDGRECRTVVSEGRSFPVETYHVPAPTSRPADMPGHAAAVIRRALAETEGDILVFLPGSRDISIVAAMLDDLAGGILVRPLYGSLSPEAQDEAMAPAPPGMRKVVLATNIAESSLSIPGISVVIDSGLEKRMRFDSSTGMGTLVTGRISLASAEQRRGRAGRFGPGTCYRLWPASQEMQMQPFARPEILDADLAALRLELALWGIAAPDALKWLDQPPAEAWNRATALLGSLGALKATAAGTLFTTDHGKAMAALPLHPRLAHMMLLAQDMGLGEISAYLAVILDERDVFTRAGAGMDIRARLAFLIHRVSHPLHAAAERLIRMLPRHGRREPLEFQMDKAALPLALTFPERVAMRRAGSSRGQYLTAGGRGAVCREDDSLADSPFLAIGDSVDDGQVLRISMAAPLAGDDVAALFADRLVSETVTRWDARSQCVHARLQTRLGSLVLAEIPQDSPSPEIMAACLAEGIRAHGLGCLPWTDSLLEWRARILFMRCFDADMWPDVRDEALLQGLEAWLCPCLRGASRLSDLQGMDLRAALESLLEPCRAHELSRLLAKEAPSHMTVPSGSVIPLAYDRAILSAQDLPARPAQPVLAVKLQELFGLTKHPTVAGGRVPVCIHLLSPAGRPVQVTGDIARFWAESYPAVRKEMRGRYPKHPWPENPLLATPTRKTKKAAGIQD